ncbi:MAG: type III-B CRISPR module RAMP protein Cmr6 [Nannocystis sp.]|nr:type III-B CRISPR module RAMP protein Cmr6 [Nannocystis sp.]
MTSKLTLDAWIDRLPPKRTSAPDQPDPWRRRDLADAWPDPLPAHVGLWLDRYLVEPPTNTSQEDKETKEKLGRTLLHRGAELALDRPDRPALAAYRPIFDRWRRCAEDSSDRGTIRRVIELKTLSRLLLHPSTATSVIDGSLLLHHTYGVPYIPGSALKGICRARARRQGLLLPQRYEGLIQGADEPRGRNQEPRWVTELFGYVEDGKEGGLAGLVDFWDALWIPPKADAKRTKAPLARDIVNPHHSTYYTAKGNERPAPRPTEDPIPTHFLSVPPDTQFLLALEGPAIPGIDNLLDFILDEFLLPALEFDGIGAKTAAGYGRLAADPVRPRALGIQDSQGNSQNQEQSRAPQEIVTRVTRKPNDGSLSATVAGGVTATSFGPAASALVAGLPEALQARLKKRQEAHLRVTWREDGNLRQIVALADPSAPENPTDR